MKILHVIHSVNPAGGGPVAGIQLTAEAMAPLGVTTEVMSLDAPDSPWARAFPLPLFALGPGRTSYGFSPRAVPWLLEHGPAYDMVIVNGLWQYGGFAVWRAARRRGFRYCVYTHGMLDPWFKRRYPLKHLKKWLYWPWGEYRVLRDAAAVLFTSEQERVDAAKSFFLYRCREKVVGYGIAPPPIEGGKRDLFLEQFPRLRGRRLVLFLGRIHEKKGCDLALRAFASFRKETGDAGTDYHLVMAGPHDHAYGGKLRALTAKLELEEAVTWTGMVEGPLKWGALAAAEVFLLPSHQENFGVAVVEALACGVPVLISDKVNIWREICADGAGLAENDDEAGTRRLLKRWAEMTPEKQAAMKTAARACFEHRFDVARVSRELLALLKTI